jgi:hypothetical protein
MTPACSSDYRTSLTVTIASSRWKGPGMFRTTLALTFVLALASAAQAADDKDAACTKGQQGIAERAKTFHGDDMIAKLIAADIERARREQGEGDPDECLEALEHADKLLKGEY